MMLDTADKLANAFRNAREGLDAQGAQESGAVNEWAKLDMKDFKELPEYESLTEIIGDRLDARGIEHAFEDEGEKSFLVFKVKDVHEISGIFHELEDATREVADRAKDADLSKNHDLGKNRDAEPLEQRAAAAREASKALDAARSVEHEIELSPSLGK